MNTLQKHCDALGKTHALAQAQNEVIACAESIEADLSGAALNSRIRNGYVLIEEARVRHLLKAMRARRAALDAIRIEST